MKKHVSKIMTALLTIYVGYKFFVIPPSLNQFLHVLEREFNEAETDIVMVSDVVDFEWTDVCYISPNATKSLNFYRGKYKEYLENHLPSFYSFGHRGAYFFLSDKLVTKKIYFSNYGYRINDHGLHAMGLNVFLGAKRYLVMSENNTENDGCIEIKNAAFIKKFSDRWKQGTIKLTNISKEKK